MRLTAFATAAVSSAVALMGFAGAAQASATIDLIWIDVTNVDSGGNPICLRPAERNCPQLGTTISSLAPADDITLGVIITAGPNGIIGAGVSVNYGDALPTLSVTDFRSLTTEPFLPVQVGPTTNQPPFIDFINAVSFIFQGVGIGLPAGQSAYIGTVSFHKDTIVNGRFEIAVGTDGPGQTDGVLDLAGNEISDSTTFNSAFLINLHDPPTPTATPTGTPSPGLPTGTPSATPTPGPPTPTPAATPTVTPTATPTPTPTSPFPEDCHPICRVDKKCSVGGSAPQDSCVASVGEEVTYTYDVDMGPVGVVFQVRDDKLGVIGQTSGERLTRTTTLTQTTTNTASVSVYYPDVCFCLGDTPDSVTVTVATPTPTPSADCLCQVTNITPDVINLNKVGTGGKQSKRLRKIIMQVKTVDAPGATCDRGESSGPQAINLLMVDDDADETQGILIDSAKTLVCDGQTQLVTRTVLVQGPLNCKDSAVPDGTSSGVITATGSAAGTADFVKDLMINCNE